MKVGSRDLIIARWPCYGHSRAGANGRLEDPKSSFLGPHLAHAVVVCPPTFLLREYILKCTPVGRFSGQGVER